jgi:hypothetical protein
MKMHELTRYAEPITVVKQISGVINGSEISGSGLSIIYPTFKGIIRNVTFFTKIPEGFNPLGIAISWMSDHCTLASMVSDEAVNLSILTNRTGGYDVTRKITYPDGSILSYTSRVQFETSDKVSVKQEFSGKYGGPPDVVRVVPYEAVMRPIGAGKMAIEATPTLVRSDGSKIQISWKEEYTFIDPTIRLQFEQIRKFEPSVQKWDFNTLTLELEAHLHTFPKV